MSGEDERTKALNQYILESCRHQQEERDLIDRPDLVTANSSAFSETDLKELIRLVEGAQRHLQEWSVDPEKNALEHGGYWTRMLLRNFTSPEGLVELAEFALKRAGVDASPQWASRLVEHIKGHTPGFMREIEVATALANAAMAEREEDGMLWLTARAADYIERLGDRGAAHAEELRSYARKALEEGTPWWVWYNPTGEYISPIMGMLADAVWHEELAADWEQQRNARSVNDRLHVVTYKGSDYAKTPKTASGLSWALGGAGVVVDANEYANAPSIMRYVPQSMAVMPSGTRPHQQRLKAALWSDEDDVGISLVARTISDTGAVLGALESKLTLAMLITGAHGMVRDTLANITRHINPTKARIQRREYERAALALRNVRRLGLALPNGTDIQLFSVQAPFEIREEQEVSWAYTPHFEQLLNQWGQRDDSLRGLNGEFLINYSALMGFNGNERNEQRHYINAAAMWNDSNDPATGRFSPDHLERFSRDKWAAKTNTLSPSAVDYLAEKGGSRRRASDDRKQAMKTLENLAAKGLVRLEGGTDDFLILPPDEHLEAYAKVRKGGVRPKGER